MQMEQLLLKGKGLNRKSVTNALDTHPRCKRGVVVSYDKETDKVTVIEAIGSSGAAEESLSKDLDGYCKGCIRKSIYTRTGKALYKHAGWKGYFRAVTTK
jgi:hypothetical protein